MPTATKSKVVDHDVHTVYNQWSHFEEFPRFMKGVDRVQQLDDRRLHSVASFGGSQHEWDAEITEQVPDERIARARSTARRTPATSHSAPPPPGGPRSPSRWSGSPRVSRRRSAARSASTTVRSRATSSALRRSRRAWRPGDGRLARRAALALAGGRPAFAAGRPYRRLDPVVHDTRFDGPARAIRCARRSSA